MAKTILITGATDGIGLETAKNLAAQGHNLLLHGRNPEKLVIAEQKISLSDSEGKIETYAADLSNIAEVEALAKSVVEKHSNIDVLVNNAGVFKTPQTINGDGLDVRFVVNTIAPYLLTQRLIPIIGVTGRVINLSSAAQSPVDTNALSGKIRVSDDFAAYAQSKLAITMWSRYMALLHKDGPVIIAVNPGSLLGSKMVKEGFGMDGKDIGIGAKIIMRLATEDEFTTASGKYFDNDSGRFASPHPDALDQQKMKDVVRVIETILNTH